MLSMFVMSCSSDVTIENTIVVEQVDVSDREDFLYKVKLQNACSECGEVFYYTNYKHQVGDTLVSIFEFTDNRESLLKIERSKLDSISVENQNLNKKNKELQLYNELLMGIIQENATKSE